MSGKKLEKVWRSIALFVLIWPAIVSAHPESLSGLRVVIADDATRTTLSLPIRELTGWFPPAKYKNYGPEVAHELAGAGLIQLQYGEADPPSPRHVDAKVSQSGTIEVDFDFPPADAKEHSIAVWSTGIGNLPNGHQQLLSVEDVRGGEDRLLAQETLNVVQDAWSGNLPEAPPTTRPAARAVNQLTPAAAAKAAREKQPQGTEPVTSFFVLGIEHILTGYDHLLFLATLLLVCDKLSDAAKVITVFTLAHSVTLALAALDIVHLPGRVVEPLIAASIIYVALENIFIQDKAQRWRRVIVFCFGLIHGLGFASVLREVGLGTSAVGLLGPLVKFNLGIETGQLAVASIILPVILLLKKRPDFVTRGVPAMSVVIAGIATFWLVQRVANGG